MYLPFTDAGHKYIFFESLIFLTNNSLSSFDVCTQRQCSADVARQERTFSVGRRRENEHNGILIGADKEMDGR